MDRLKAYGMPIEERAFIGENIQQSIINITIIDIGYILFLCKLLSMTKQILKSIHTDNITKTVP